MGLMKPDLRVYRLTWLLCIDEASRLANSQDLARLHVVLFQRFLDPRPIAIGAKRTGNGERGVTTEGRLRYSPPGMLAIPAVVDSNGR